MLEDTSAGVCGLRVGVECSEGRFGVDGTWRRSWEDGPVRMGRGAGGGLTWGHRLRPSQNRCSGGAGESAPGDCGVSGPDTKSIAARARDRDADGGGGPGSPSLAGLLNPSRAGGLGWPCSLPGQLCSSPALCASSPPPDRIHARRWAGPWIRGPSPLWIIIAPGSGGGPLAEPVIPTMAALQDWTRPSVHLSSAPPAPGATDHPA